MKLLTTALAVAIMLAGAASADEIIPFKGDRFECRVVEASHGTTVTYRKGEKAATLKIDEVDRILFDKARTVKPPFIVLRNGDVVACTAFTIAKERIEAETSVGKITVPLKNVKAFVLAVSDKTGGFLTKGSTQDALLMKNGGTVAGVLLSADAESLGVQTKMGDKTVTTSIKKKGIAAVRLAKLREPDAFEGKVRIRLKAGSSFLASAFSLNKDGVGTFTALWGAGTLRLGALAQLQFNVDKITYLSDLTPTKVVEKPFNKMFRAWHYQNDRTVLFDPICVRGKRYKKGLGMYPFCELTYKVPKGAKSFMALAALDDSAKAGTKAVFTISASKPTRAHVQAMPVTKKDGGKWLTFALAGEKEITLQVNFAEGDMGISSICVLADAKFIK